uniref:Chromatin assembly factor 1 subunit A n=1 Tax=Caenorhabditis tropicalis TaxID=1561998 RepID=A0A1I7T4F5_9PELO
MTLAPILTRKALPADLDLLVQNDHIISIASFINSAEPTAHRSRKASKMKVKLFQFYENHRPPYYGTWRKKSKVISGSCPLAEEEGIDYEVDSDDEWEDEPSDGEECNSDEEADKDNDDEDGDEEEDGFFVPPCYLSDGEGDEDTASDVESGEKKKKPKRVTIDSDDEESSNDAAERKARLAQRAEEWAKLTEKKKVAVVKPRAVGPVFNAGPDQLPEFKFMYAVKFY